MATWHCQSPNAPEEKQPAQDSPKDEESKKKVPETVPASPDHLKSLTLPMKLEMKTMEWDDLDELLKVIEHFYLFYLFHLLEICLFSLYLSLRFQFSKFKHPQKRINKYS